MIKFPLLSTEDIEVKCKQITKSGALMLLYKTARVDAKILDSTLGPMNWTNEFKEIKGNLYCRVGIREDSSQEFVFKEDCGIESGQDDGNEKKAEASDAFKRCCSKLGIGRELYTTPQIWASVATVERNGKWMLEDPYAKYVVTKIEYNEETRVITAIQICNAKTNKSVFEWELPKAGAMAKKMVNTIKVEEKPEDQTQTKPSLRELQKTIGNMLMKHKNDGGDLNEYKEIVSQIAPSSDFQCNKATESDYDIVEKIYNALKEKGYSV